MIDDTAIPVASVFTEANLGHWCPWHEKTLKTLRMEEHAEAGLQIVCECCPECQARGGSREEWHDDRTDDFCWCDK